MRKKPTDPGFALYRELVKQENETAVIVRTDFEETEAQDTWFEVTQSECKSFCIDPRLANALSLAFSRFESMMGIVDDIDFEEVRAHDRAAYPQFYNAGTWVADNAAGFMVVACGLPANDCTAWVCRYQIQLIRSGLTTGQNKAPRWAYAKTRLGTAKDQADIYEAQRKSPIEHAPGHLVKDS